MVDTVLENTQWVIGNDMGTNFRLDNWLGDSLVNIFKIPSQFHVHLTLKICDFGDNSCWNFHYNVITSLLGHLSCISKIHFPLVEADDKLAWTGVDNGHLSLKFAYISLSSSATTQWIIFPWNPNIPPSQSMAV